MESGNDKIRECINIVILVAPINNGNMGCIALTYSLLTMLEKVSKDLQVTFNYYNSVDLIHHGLHISTKRPNDTDKGLFIKLIKLFVGKI